jgi:glucose-1-phosphate adenylyltransferase
MAYPFRGYWVDVGTLQAYWETSLALLEDQPALDLYDPAWVIHTRSEERPPVKCSPPGSLVNSLASNGCIIHGQVVHSVLSPGVRVEAGAMVRDSVIMNDSVIRAGARIDRCVIDKQVEIGADAVLGLGDDTTPNRAEPGNLHTGLTVVGKRAVVPAQAEIGRNCRIDPNVTPGDFGVLSVPSGETVRRHSPPR